MARRRLEVPSADELKKIEEGFARETSGAGPGGPRAPIAHVAGEAAALSAPLPAPLRAQAARDSADAQRLRRAEAEGLLITEIGIDDIHAEELARDRMRIDGAQMDELRASIRAHGLRLPIEVFELSEPRDGRRYGLISGCRRLSALRGLHAETGDAGYGRVRAFIRRPENAQAAYVAMVEENEIRAELSQYERGRVAVLAAGEGAFPSVETAVEALFHAGSRAKRSKVRSFALIHEELGDLLSFAPALSERAGLRLAQALRAGYGAQIRGALATGQGVSAEREWSLLEPLILAAEAEGSDPARGGRPRAAAGAKQAIRGDTVPLANGMSVRREHDGKNYLIRFSGKQVDAGLVDTVMLEIQRLLGPE